METVPACLSFGWEKARVLGAFFNGVLLLALAISVFLQSAERFVSMHRACSVLFLSCPLHG